MRLTIQAGIVKLTRKKKRILDREYNNLQRFLHGEEDVPLYSANKQQAQRYYKKIKPHKEYPLSLRKDLINLRRAKAFWFLKIPVHGVWGGLKVPVKPHRPFPDGELCESKIVRKNGRYIAMLVFQFEPPKLRECSSILAVDLGERVVATAVLLQNGNVMKAKFYGREIRGIRRHYSWLRRRLQERGLIRDVKRIGSKERRCVNAVLHRVSKRIVSLADSSDSYIVLGDLTGIREDLRGNGKRLNRIVSNMPYYRLTEMIVYKARMKGIPVILAREWYTSVTCSRCGSRRTSRPHQALFLCKTCGYELNADLNAAINIGKKFEGALGYMPLAGASCEHALNQTLSLEAPCES